MSQEEILTNEDRHNLEFLNICWLVTLHKFTFELKELFELNVFSHRMRSRILELGLALGLSVFLLLKNWTLGKHSYVFCYYMVIVSSAVFESHVEFILSPRYCGIGWVSVVLRERSSCSSRQHIEGHLGWGLSLVTMATWFKESLSTWDMETITIHIFQKYHELLIRSYIWKCTGSYIML